MTTSHSVVAATVTYADRSESCLSVARAALDRGASACVIVDNGSSDDSAARLRDAADGDHRLTIVRLDRNRGSAEGFSTAIATALRTPGAEWIWLLDDDNLPRPDALDRALQTAEEHGRGTAVACLRSSDPLQRAVASGAPVERTLALAGSFMGFDLAQRLVRRHGPTAALPTGAIAIPWAPYGGLLVAAEDAGRVPPPYPSFVLYGDDRDWCERLEAAGTRILLEPRAVVDDLIDRWSPAQPTADGGVLERMISSGDERRAFYLIRNTAFQDRRAVRTARSAVRFVLNVTIYAAAASVTSVRVGRPRFTLLFARALASGLKGSWYGPAGP